ncbi:unnamed protein product [Somion occarium]|uniref:Uncharacterized protein n=1 Tax=Somion occarium TaxID=3059160 RepID=A0ABP1ECK7_9APHY
MNRFPNIRDSETSATELHNRRPKHHTSSLELTDSEFQSKGWLSVKIVGVHQKTGRSGKNDQDNQFRCGRRSRSGAAVIVVHCSCRDTFVGNLDAKRTCMVAYFFLSIALDVSDSHSTI